MIIVQVLLGFLLGVQSNTWDVSICCLVRHRTKSNNGHLSSHLDAGVLVYAVDPTSVFSLFLNEKCFQPCSPSSIPTYQPPVCSTRAAFLSLARSMWDMGPHRFSYPLFTTLTRKSFYLSSSQRSSSSNIPRYKCFSLGGPGGWAVHCKATILLFVLDRPFIKHNRSGELHSDRLYTTEKYFKLCLLAKGDHVFLR